MVFHVQKCCESALEFLEVNLVKCLGDFPLITFVHGCVQLHELPLQMAICTMLSYNLQKVRPVQYMYVYCIIPW